MADRLLINTFENLSRISEKAFYILSAGEKLFISIAGARMSSNDLIFLSHRILSVGIGRVRG